MSEWLEEIGRLEDICEKTKDCKDCKLGYCIKEKGENESCVSNT